MLSSFFTKKEKNTVEWRVLTDISTLDEIDKMSIDLPVLIFKHSTRCAISSMTLNKFESNYQENSGFEKYFLDLIAYREVSNEVEARYGVMHQSPQAILISKGKAIYDESHTGIVYSEIVSRSKEVR